MSTEVERGLSCEIEGDVNLKLTAPSTRISAYTGLEVMRVWALVESLVKAAADWSNGEFQVEDALNLLLTRKAILWLVWTDGELFMAITEIRDYPRKRVCHVYAAAGKGINLTGLLILKEFRSWFLSQGVTEVTAICRESVARLIARAGFEKVADVMRFTWKELL